MMTDVEVAKMLLSNKTCDTCIFREHAGSEFVPYCARYVTASDLLSYEALPLPEQNTCDEWKKK
jgi:hypothetical protein